MPALFTTNYKIIITTEISQRNKCYVDKEFHVMEFIMGKYIIFGREKKINLEDVDDNIFFARFKAIICRILL